MPFNVKNKRNDDGTYTLSYGKGKQKLTATMSNTADGWAILDDDAPVSDTFKKMKDCKAAWGEWAETAYGADSEPASPPPAPPGPPKIKKSSPPPIRKASGPPKIAAKPKPLTEHREADPFDPRFRDADKHITPLGILVEIMAWGERHKKRISEINARLAEKSGPGYNPFDSLLDSVEQTIARECPDLTPEGKYVSTKEKAKLTPDAARAAAASYANPDAERALAEHDEDDSIPF